MLGLFIGLLTVVLVLDCVFLVLLVLVQLPKKEAGGMGQAFGGGATDALFGAGSGNALTKMTKWTAGIFFVLAILLTIMGNYAASRGGGAKLQEIINKAPAPTPPPAAQATPPPAATKAPIKLDVPPVTPPPAPAATNAAAK